MKNFNRRADWGAADGGGSLRSASVITDIVGHYTTGQQLARDAEDSAGWVRNIQHYHMNELDWSDIGYHFLYDRYGQIFEGRPIEIIGAHASGFNKPSIGVAFLGTDNPDVVDVTPEAKQAFVNIVDWSQSHLSRLLSLSGHRDHGQTACPGDEKYRWLHAGAPLDKLDVEPGGEDGGGVRNYVTVGDVGKEVLALQRELARLLPDHPDAHKPDSHFGPKTHRLVLAAYELVHLKASNSKRPRVGPRSMAAFKAAAPKREPWRGKRVVAKTNVRFYAKPGWYPANRPAGTLKDGWGFRGGIHDEIRVGGGRQYLVSNSNGQRFWITSSPKYVELRSM